MTLGNAKYFQEKNDGARDWYIPELGVSKTPFLFISLYLIIVSMLFCFPCLLPFYPEYSLSMRSVVSDYIDLSEKQIVPLCHEKPWSTFPDSFLPLEKDNWYNIQQTTQGLEKSG